MNATAFRHFFNYHFAENRKLWDTCIMTLSDAEFADPVSYSLGALRNHVVHLMSVDDTWFSGLRGAPIPDPLDPADFADRAAIRAYWDDVEQRMRDWLAALRDDRLFDTPLDGEDAGLAVWQVLLHVVNHGTDHRAQMLRMLYDLGVQTTAQDYIFYAYDYP